MKRMTILLVLLLPLVTVAQNQPEDFPDARVVNILQEPRHRVVHQDDDVWLLDVQINPGDTTLPHTHDAAIMYTFISNGEEALHGRVSSNTDYVEASYTHRVHNEGPGLFRIIALTNYGPPRDGAMDRPDGLTVDASLENPWFRSYRRELAPGESTPELTHQNPAVIVQVTEGRVHVSREDGITAELDAMGDWAWRETGSPYRVSNVSAGPVTVVINEARRRGE
ncbi:MAG: hypothetical protein ACQETO_00295 [Pseudomonadota bacterium]